MSTSDSVDPYSRTAQDSQSVAHAPTIPAPGRGGPLQRSEGAWFAAGLLIMVVLGVVTVLLLERGPGRRAAGPPAAAPVPTAPGAGAAPAAPAPLVSVPAAPGTPVSAAPHAPREHHAVSEFHGSGGDGEEQHRYVTLHAGHCYTFSSSGGGSMHALYVYLWAPTGRRVVTEKHSRSPVFVHCAAQTGTYHFVAKAAGGSGPFHTTVTDRGDR